MMRIKVTKPLNTRIGGPYRTFKAGTVRVPGEELDVLGTVTGENVDTTNDIWYQVGDPANSYFWSGGANNIPKQTNPFSGKVSQLINWNSSVPNVPSNYLSTKGDQIRVGILDTGIEKNHPDLKNNIIGDISDFTDPNVNGIDDDTDGHGTFIAGIIGANSPYLNGIIGVSPSVKLSISKIQGNQRSKPGGEQIYQGLNQLLQLSQPPHIYNLSVGFEGPCSQDLLTLLNSLSVNNAFLIAAAGDNNDLTSLDSNNNPQQIQFPAGHPACIKVGTISQDCLNFYSDISSRVDVICPLLGFWSCSNATNEYYTQLPGSSMATAFISGIIALILSNKLNNNIPIDNITKQEILSELKTFSTPVNNFDFNNANQFIFNIP